MEDELLKFRGLQPNPMLPFHKLVKKYLKMVKDGRENNLDPFPYKYSVQPPNKS